MSLTSIINGSTSGLATIQCSFHHGGTIFVIGHCTDVTRIDEEGLAKNLLLLKKCDGFDFAFMFRPGQHTVSKIGAKIMCNGKTILEVEYRGSEPRDEQGLPLPPDTKKFIKSLMRMSISDAKKVVC